MASVDKRPDGKWRARWREYANGPQKTRHFDRKIDAERFLTTVQHGLLTGGYVDPALGKTSFREVADRYLALGDWRERTRETARERLAYALAEFGDRSIASIRKPDVQAFLNRLSLAPSTKRVVHQHLAAALEVAVEDGLIAVNPARRIKLPKAERPAVFVPTIEEVTALREAASPWFSVAVLLGAGLGLRLGEAAGLTVDRIDFLRHTVRVDRQWQQPTGARPGGLVRPKTEASTRTIPAAHDVLDEIAAHLARANRRDGFVVQHEGQPLSAAKWEYELRKARRDAKVRSELTFHDLRHFYASALIGAGCSVKAVQTALGHASAKLTLDTYAHLWPGDEDRIRGAISGVFSEWLRTG